MGAKRAERQGIVAGSPQQCFDALAEFETYPDWQAAVRRCTVHSRDEAGRARRIEFEIDAKVRSVGYTLDYSYDEPHLMSWEFVEGDVKDVEGEFLLEDLGDGTTLVTYALRIDPGIWVPGKIVSLLTDGVMQRVVDDLKQRVETAV